MPVSRCMRRARAESGDARGVPTVTSRVSTGTVGSAHLSALQQERLNPRQAILTSPSVSAMHVGMGTYLGVSVACPRRAPLCAASCACALYLTSVHPASANTHQVATLHRAQESPVRRTFKAVKALPRAWRLRLWRFASSAICSSHLHSSSRRPTCSMPKPSS